MSGRCSDCPDIGYLLRDFDAVYRYGSAGGSARIRSHLRRVREAISGVLSSDAEVVDRKPHSLPVTAHLPRALDVGSRSPLAALSGSVARLVPRLTWEYGYERVPRGLVDSYGYCELAGPRGPVMTERIILGLVLLAPGTTYPQHHHEGIEESYVTLAGTWSENDAAVHVPGSLILNTAGQQHRLTTGRTDPCLLAYAWLGEPDRLTHPGMGFSRRRQDGRPATS